MQSLLESVTVADVELWFPSRRLFVAVMMASHLLLEVGARVEECRWEGSTGTNTKPV